MGSSSRQVTDCGSPAGVPVPLAGALAGRRSRFDMKDLLEPQTPAGRDVRPRQIFEIRRVETG